MPDSDSDIDLAELDAMSSSDEDSSDDEGPGMLGAFMEKQKKKNQLTDFDGFNDGDEGTVVEKMKTILALRASLGIDDDKSFMEEQKKKDEERKRLESMTDEERLQYEEGKAGDVMARIRAKHAEKMKAMEAKRQSQGAASSLLGDPGMKKKKKDGIVGPDGKKKKKKKPAGEELPTRQLKKSSSEKLGASADATGGKKKVGKLKRTLENFRKRKLHVMIGFIEC